MSRPAEEVRPETVYREYQGWCERNGQQADSLTSFKRGLETFGEIKRKRPQGAGKSTNPVAMLCGLGWLRT